MATPAAPGSGEFQLFTSVLYDAGLQDATENPVFAHAGWNYTQFSCYYMLDFHRDRLLRAATHWGWDAAVSAVTGEAGLQRLEEVLDGAVKARAATGAGQYRCRVTLRQDGQLGCEIWDAAAKPLAALFPPQLPVPGFMTAGPEIDDGAGDAPSLLVQLRTAMGQAPYTVVLDVDKTASSPYTHFKTTQRKTYEAARQRAGIVGPEPKEVLLVNADSGMVMDGSICTVYVWRNGRWVTPPVPPRYDKERGSGGLDGTTRRWALERNLAVEDDVAADSLQHGEECWLSNGVRGFIFGKVSLE